MHIHELNSNEDECLQHPAVIQFGKIVQVRTEYFVKHHDVADGEWTGTKLMNNDAGW